LRGKCKSMLKQQMSCCCRKPRCSNQHAPTLKVGWFKLRSAQALFSCGIVVRTKDHPWLRVAGHQARLSKHRCSWSLICTPPSGFTAIIQMPRYCTQNWVVAAILFVKSVTWPRTTPYNRCRGGGTIALARRSNDAGR
jgi:hypothetical protein